jgi:hypothetical protein
MVGKTETTFAFVARLFHILRMGVEVGITSGMSEEDWETGETWFTLFGDLKFRMRDGKVYCKGGSVAYPPPATDEDGWEIEPVDKSFFESMFEDGTIHEVMVSIHGSKINVWSSEHGWDNSKNFLNAGSLQKVDTITTNDTVNENKGLMSLKLLAAEVARQQLGTFAMREYAHFMDFEVHEALFKPSSWWVKL